MFGIDRITWTEVSPLLDEGLGLSIDEREAWLDDSSSCAGWVGIRPNGPAPLLNDWGLKPMSLGRPRDADWAFSQSVAISRADASGASVSPMLLLNAARPVRRCRSAAAQRLPPGHGAFASLTLQRANIALARGQLLEARRMADEALAKAEAVGPGDELVSGTLLRRGASRAPVRNPRPRDFNSAGPLPNLMSGSVVVS